MTIEQMNSFKIILGSASPRRKQLLSELGLNFEVRLVDQTDESFPQNLPANEVASFLAEKKSNTYLNKISEKEVLITADTVVILEEEILNKPANRAEAIEMLNKLSGQKHQVMTGVCIRYNKHISSFSSNTDVYFKELTNQEITHYVDHYKPYDKAGAYGIQEWIGFIGIRHIEGSYFNVMGLPVQKLYEELIQILRK